MSEKIKHFLLSYLNSQVSVHVSWELSQRGLQLPIVVPKQLSSCTQQAMNMTAVVYILKFVICIIYVFILLFQD